MDKELLTLLDLAIHHLLSNESAAIYALEEISSEIFIPLYSAAFKNAHKNIV